MSARSGRNKCSEAGITHGGGDDGGDVEDDANDLVEVEHDSIGAREKINVREQVGRRNPRGTSSTAVMMRRQRWKPKQMRN